MAGGKTFLCISCYFKGEAFLKACKAEGNTVFLLTRHSLKDKPWPREAIDDFFYIDSDENSPRAFENLTKGLAYLMRTIPIDRIVALDDFDVEKGAYLREQFRIPGMGQSTARFFRDKLAMRVKAAEAGLPVPGFSALFNNESIHRFTNEKPGPWVVKPRGEASAIGIKKVQDSSQLWDVLNQLGEDRHHYLVEQFKPGAVYHADALSFAGKMLFCKVSEYLTTPFEVAHGGGIFRTCTLPDDHNDALELKDLNSRLMRAFGMQYSASHTEYIKSKADGSFYFLETSSRVGGAHIAEMVEAASGLNLWTEWARIESAMADGSGYELPEVRYDSAGLIVSLSRFQHPDSSLAFNDPEIAWRMSKEYHIGLIVRSANRERILKLLDSYAERISKDFHASLPVKDKHGD